jgi:hypothetical protein
MREIEVFEAKNKLGTLLDWGRRAKKFLSPVMEKLWHDWFLLNLASIAREPGKQRVACSKPARKRPWVD